MSVIAVINQKGGCGKTTTSVNLTAALAIKEKKVLLIDMDPQGHAAYGFNINSAELDKTVYDVLCEDLSFNDIKLKYNDFIDIAPGNISLAKAEQVLANKDNREKRLALKLEQISGNYDFVIIDCPPNLGFISINALMAADRAILPIEPGRFGFDGVQRISDTIKVLEQKADKKIEVRHLVSMYDIDSEFSRNFVEEIKTKLPASFFETVINRTTAIREATSKGLPVCYDNIHSISYVDYLSLAHEVVLWENKEIIEEAVVKNAAGPFKTKEGVCFLIKAEGATNVQLAGDFNNWNPDAHTLSQVNGKNGLWYAILPLNSGKYSYRYVVDGEWREDENNPEYEESLFGVKQSVIKI